MQKKMEFRAERTKDLTARRDQAANQRKLKRVSQRPKVTAEFFERAIRESRRDIKERHSDSEYQSALRNFPENDVQQRFIVPEEIMNEFEAKPPAPSIEQPSAPSLPPSLPSSLNTTQRFDTNNILATIEEQNELARLSAKNDLTSEDKDNLAQLQMAQNKPSMGTMKELGEQATLNGAMVIEGREERDAKPNTRTTEQKELPPPEDDGIDEVTDFSKENFPNEKTYLRELNLFFLASTVADKPRATQEENADEPLLQEWLSALLSLAPTNPPDRPTNRVGEVLTDVALSVRAEGTLLDAWAKVFVHPIALHKYHDLMGAETQERFLDQLFMYKQWQSIVETVSYGPVLWANSYLRQILPKLRKLQSKRDAQFQRDNRSRQKGKAVMQRRIKEGTLRRRDTISPRNITENYKTLNPIVEPELVLRKPVFNNMPGREAMFNSVASAILKNPSFTMKQKRGLITRYGYGLQHMGTHMPVTISQEERDAKMKQEFERERLAKIRKVKRRPIRIAKRAIEREVFEQRMYYIPSVDYNLDDMDRRNQRSTAPL